MPEVNNVSFDGKTIFGSPVPVAPVICTSCVCYILAGEHSQPRDVVARNQPLNFIQHGHRIVWAHLGLEVVRRKPHGVAVGFARLRSARLAHVGAGPPPPNGTSLCTS